MGNIDCICNEFFSVKYPDSAVLFKPQSRLDVIKKEGVDAFIPCLLTDPAATDVQLRMENGSAPPPDMDITFDPKEGMLIRNLKPWFSSTYVCSARIGGVEKVSQAFTLRVIESKCLQLVVRLYTYYAMANNCNKWLLSE